MIIQTLLEGVLELLTVLLELIPDASLPTAAAEGLEDFAALIGNALGGLDAMLPISELAVFVGWVLGTYVPIVFAYQLSHWVWTHLPVIGNGA